MLAKYLIYIDKIFLTFMAQEFKDLKNFEKDPQSRMNHYFQFHHTLYDIEKRDKQIS